MKRTATSVLTVGVTGGIGAGKTEVCSIFASLGASVLSADDVAKDLMAHDPAVARLVRGAFGEGVYGPDGSLRPKELAKIVFADPAARGRLEAIVHPATVRALRARITEIRTREAPPVIAVEAALLLEAETESMFDYIIAVDAPRELQVARVTGRDGTSAREVERRMSAQLPNEEKVKRADFVIRNDGSREKLAEAAAFVWRLLVGIGAAR